MLDRVSFENVTVDFPIYDISSRSLKHKLVLQKVSNLVSRKQNVGGNVRQGQDGIVLVRALDDNNFNLNDGDRVAILGHNGSGKTTLLRVAAGIYEPLQGDVTTKGRVMPLFNIMEGLTPDAKGSEMIRVRGALLGLSDNEIEENQNVLSNN